MATGQPTHLTAVSPNPAIDRVALIAGEPHGVVKATDFLETPGGKAIHVAMVCSKLGGQASVLATAGGPNGTLLRDLLEQENLPASLVETEAQTRGTYSIVSVTQADLAEVHEPSGALTTAECDRLVGELEAKVVPDSVVAICGSLPPGSPVELHARLVEVARSRGATTLLDCSTPEALAPALEAGPDLVAPNLAEARRLTDSERSGPADEDEIDDLLEALTRGGVAAAWLTLGSEGSVLRSGGETRRMTAPAPGRAVNAIGCGDALLGGLAAGLIAGRGMIEAAAVGVAAATDKLTHLHPGRVDPDAVERLTPLVTVEPGAKESSR